MPHSCNASTYCPMLNEFSGILEVSSNVLHQSGLLLLTQDLAPECTHLREVVVIGRVVALCITSCLKIEAEERKKKRMKWRWKREEVEKKKEE